MPEESVKKIGKRLASVFHLRSRPIAIYGREKVPRDAVPMRDIHRCIAEVLYRMSTDRHQHGVYTGGEVTEGCCPGGLTYLGYLERPSYIRYFVSTGSDKVRGGAAEFLKAGPDLVDRSIAAVGTIDPIGKYLVAQPCERVPDDIELRSMCLFGNAEQIRNVAALVHFGEDDPFQPVLVPWGAACATMITYPAGLASRAPRESAFMGPQDPTFNHVLPPHCMVVGIPAKVVRKMVQNLDQSFVIKRPQVAFPQHDE